MLQLQGDFDMTLGQCNLPRVCVCLCPTPHIHMPLDVYTSSTPPTKADDELSLTPSLLTRGGKKGVRRGASRAPAPPVAVLRRSLEPPPCSGLCFSSGPDAESSGAQTGTSPVGLKTLFYLF